MNCEASTVEPARDVVNPYNSKWGAFRCLNCGHLFFYRGRVDDLMAEYQLHWGLSELVSAAFQEL